jgi:regulator of replication initiation timing
VARETALADLAARDEEIMRLEHEIAELRKRRQEDAGKVHELRENLDEKVAAQIGVQQDKWRAQVKEVVDAYQEENLELEVFNEVLKAKSSARTVEATARADQVAALVRENSHLRVALEQLCDRLESSSVSGESPRNVIRTNFTPVSETL